MDVITRSELPGIDLGLVEILRLREAPATIGSNFMSSSSPIA